MVTQDAELLTLRYRLCWSQSEQSTGCSLRMSAPDDHPMVCGVGLPSARPFPADLRALLRRAAIRVIQTFECQVQGPCEPFPTTNSPSKAAPLAYSCLVVTACKMIDASVAVELVCGYYFTETLKDQAERLH